MLIDADPQGSLSISLKNPQPDKLPFTLSDAMANIELSGMEVSLVNAMSRETILQPKS